MQQLPFAHGRSRRASGRRLSEAKALQNYWVVGGGGGGGGRGRGGGSAGRNASTGAPSPQPSPSRMARKFRASSLRLDNFLRDAAARRWPVPHVPPRRRSAEVEVKDPLEAHKALPAMLDRQGHARRNRLPGDTQMTLKKILVTASLLVRSGFPARARARSRSGQAAQAARRRVADLQRRLFRQALQPAHADQSPEREEPHARVDGAATRQMPGSGGAGGGGRGGGRGGGGGNNLIIGGEGTGDYPGWRSSHDQSVGADGRRHAST